MTQFKDLFSKQSGEYAKFRPTYPPELFDYLAKVSPDRKLAWDCGTGNGQAAMELGKRFERVIATDPSEKQLGSAERHPHVEYRVGPAESSGLAPGSVDLVTAAQAFHWFKAPEFFEEAHRILKPGGILAFWCYALAKITPEIDSVILRLYEGILGPYWEKERRLVDDEYRSIELPKTLFEEVQTPRFEMTAQWSVQHLSGYLGTWSALQTYIKKNSQNPLEIIGDELVRAWGNEPVRTVRWELGIRVGSRAFSR